MKLATTTGDYFEYKISQDIALEHISDVGFKYADYNFNIDRDRQNGVFGETCAEYIDKISKTAQRKGIKLVQAHAPMGRPLVDGGLLADTLRCVDVCGEWGIPNIVVHSGYDLGLSPQQTFERNKEFFMPLLERAEKYGINILVENFNKMETESVYWIDNAPDLLKMIECVNHPLFHAVWDVGHANMQKMPQDEAIRMLGNHIKALHIQDNMGERDEHIAPFFGTLNLDSVMCGLNDIGYNGYFTFEVGRTFIFQNKRVEYSRSKLLANPPIEVRDAFEQYLYELGKNILQKYNCFEE